MMTFIPDGRNAKNHRMRKVVGKQIEGEHGDGLSRGILK
jgi:hypothetical protein